MRGTVRCDLLRSCELLQQPPLCRGLASAHPEITGGILSQARAAEVAEQIFGQLLRLSGSGLAGAKGQGALASRSGFP